MAPEVAQQLRIVQEFEDIRAHHATQHLEAFVLWCLLRDERDTLETMLDAADAYWLSLEIVRNITARLGESFQPSETIDSI